MSPGQIQELARHFEIGGHTLNHINLSAVPEKQAWREIRDGKHWLEQVIGKSVVSFCYPWGKFNRRVVRMVRDAGFLGARTCFINLHSFPQNPFLWGVSTQAWSHSRILQLRHAMFECNFIGALNFFRVYKGATDWQEHFLHALDYVELHGGVAHMSLHSWEVEGNEEWQKLDSALKLIAERKLLVPLSNGALFRLWKPLTYAHRDEGPFTQIEGTFPAEQSQDCTSAGHSTLTVSTESKS